ncbi:hypothetical protein BASA50_009879 [Batrachochytrium salamandrivorans]|uniref:Nucleolar complex-associated protein 3 n=1 Tax=Batrachochytrium salamandrivorans TaxID=1357716 RepID=A0ABQ8F003_9FUNG|nr:hypothetical protein BASA62_004925 [Batrachochytrium salamandrivorans]KAH6580664.1 hypothetical protein BASA61_009475 [Batrachochytrium salamandrivorans]KAH6589623.1 hypothetical protein BASA50_009879 [Batrachochytrium salamandrivorans]KAH9265135.1 hypothetical protein BASA83_011366 [Batrachochytrium salamandrivorans]
MGKRSWKQGYKDPLLQHVAANDASDDENLSEQDMEAMEEYGEQGLSFLKALDPRSLLNTYQKERLAAPRSRGTVAIQVGDDVSDQTDQDSESVDSSLDSDAEASYELAPRAGQKDTSLATGRLPIKTRTGELLQQQNRAVEPDTLKSATDLLELKDKAIEDTIAPAITKKSIVAAKPKKIAPATPMYTLSEARERLASAASQLIENPEANIGELKALHRISKTSDSRIIKLALLTELTVFKDIIPGYRIRKLSEKELSAQVSKEVKRLRQYEESLLGSYQIYLQHLEDLVSNICSSDDNSSIPGVALLCLCDLLKSVPHFNFRLNIMTVVMSSLQRVKIPALIDACCDSFDDLLRGDVSGEASLDAVKLISKFAKKTHQIRPRIIKTFLSLRLLDELQVESDGGIRKSHPSKKRKLHGQVPYVSKKMRKINRAHAEVDEELHEAEATVDRAERQKLHSETLKHVFLTYFRILKEAPESPLVLPALEGLGKFSHLINIDFFNDLVAAIKKICLHHLNHINMGVELSRSLSISLQCILTVLQLLAAIKDAIKTDLLQFHTATYDMLSKLATRVPSTDLASLHSNPHSDHSKIGLMLLVLEIMFQRPQDMAINRVASFVKRLSTVALNLTDNASIAALSVVHKIIMRLPRLHSLLDGEETIGSGVYKPYVQDVDLCNPFATSLWELTIMAESHYHPAVRKAASMVLHHSDGSASRALPSELQSLTRGRPLHIMEEFDSFYGGSFAIHPACKLPGRQLIVPAIVHGPSVVGFSAFLENLELRLE